MERIKMTETNQTNGNNDPTLEGQDDGNKREALLKYIFDPSQWTQEKAEELGLNATLFGSDLGMRRGDEHFSQLVTTLEKELRIEKAAHEETKSKTNVRQFLNIKR